MQRYLWQQADGRRHAYDTQTNTGARSGQPFTALCGETVTPKTERGDLTAGLWFDPECRDCVVRLAAALGWTDNEIAQMVARWEEVA